MPPPSQTVALALSGGGAAGLGHIPVLEAFDSAGIRPCAIAGSSMGALIGACYAAGMTGAEIRAHVTALHTSPQRIIARLWGEAGFGALPGMSGLDGTLAIDCALPEDIPTQIEHLEIPLTVIATDFHAKSELRLTTGDLRIALAASCAIPGVFKPVRVDGRLCVDAGLVNNLPLAALPEADILLGVDVARGPVDQGRDDAPGPLALMAGSMRIMIHQMMSDRAAQFPTAQIVEPGSCAFGILEFRRVPEILAAAEPVRTEVLDILRKVSA